MDYNITPRVDATQEFIEIANDFANPLDIVREAISNSYDAKATKIFISFEAITQSGERMLKISINDNGEGMDNDGLQSFFDLGNSLRRDDIQAIGDKGHGTKVYFNSKRVEVSTKNNQIKLCAVMDEPFIKLHRRELPAVVVKKSENDSKETGTEITIYGYNNNRSEKFTHEIIKDHVMWFSKHGAFDNIFNPDKHTNVILFLKGLGCDNYEEIPFGHHFPEDSKSVNKLFDEHLTKAPDYYCKRIKKEGRLRNYPEIKYNAIFCLEGKYVKYGYNSMIRRHGYTAPSGAYQIQERYGLWLCKDFIPIQRKNEWITFKGAEYTKFHAFFNCQNFKLTANRGSVENTPSEILSDIEEVIKKEYEEIINSDDWRSMEWLEEEASAFQTIENEKSQFEWRKKKINKANVANYKGITLVEPERESGVFSLFLILSNIEKDMFPFQIIDYDTHEGLDVIAKSNKATPVASSTLYYVEFKRNLTNSFNHSFENLFSIVCWDTEIKHDGIIADIKNIERKLQIIQPSNEKDYTKYFLDDPSKAHKIEVFVLKYYLKEKYGIDFKPRTKDAVV
ncbi:MAG TPA: ATP-binding protein [Thermodesulfobacteriota bacterium]|nr:ATP-binding protein [Thermodesulfobacteriota bacterium]